MPRGKAKFTTGSPNNGNWPNDPEQAMREIAAQNNAEYIEGSLVFVPGGHLAEALFKTVEPEPPSGATMLHQLGRDLNASDVTLYIDPEGWQTQRSS